MMARLLHWFRLMLFSCQRIGVFPMLRSRLVGLLRRSAARHDDFDQTYGTDTAGSLIPSEVNITGNDARHASAYTPIESADFHRMIEAMGLPHAALRTYTFVDLGSGKGRAVLLAATYPFKRVFGIEMSAMLHHAAAKNVATFQARMPACPPIELCCQDATTFAFPDDPLVLYFFHPFDETIMARVMENVRQAVHKMPRPVFLLYNRGINLQPYTPALLAMGGMLHCVAERPPDGWNGQTGWYVYRTA